MCNLIWKDVNVFDYNYQISNYGDLRCLNPYHKSMMLKNYQKTDDGKGYIRYVLVKNKKPISKFAHRLVAEYFLDNFSDELTVNHKDFDTKNNYVENLEMATMTENVNHYLSKLKELKNQKRIGVSFHKGINKWQTRVTYNGKRYNLGVFDSEDEAVSRYDDFKSGKNISFEKHGNHLIGKFKFTQEQEKEALILSYEIGVKKASLKTGIGCTKITLLRKINKEWSLKKK